MGIFDMLFGRKSIEENKKEILSQSDMSFKQIDNSYEEVPPYIEADPADYVRVSLIATAIATNDNPSATFKVTKIKKRNPEVIKIATIASSVVAVNEPNNLLVIKKIRRRKDEENVKKI